MNTVEKLAYRTKMAEAFIRGHFADEEGGIRGTVDIYEADAVYQKGMEDAEELEQAIGKVDAYEKVVLLCDNLIDGLADAAIEARERRDYPNAHGCANVRQVFTEFRNAVVILARAPHAKIDNVKKGLYDQG